MSERAVTYHLTPVAVWRSQSHVADYVPEAFAREGFIHCTDGEALVLDAGNRYYTGDPRPYCLLTIAVDHVTAEIRYEDANRVYPHIYGPLNTDAVTAVRSVEREPDGRFVAIGDELPQP